MTRHIHVIGIGAGDPDYVTAQAVAALNDTQVFFAMDKGDGEGATWWRCAERSASGSSREPGYRFVELADPPRARRRRLPAGGRRLARGPGAGVGDGDRDRTRSRRRRRLPGLG